MIIYIVGVTAIALGALFLHAAKSGLKEIPEIERSWPEPMRSIKIKAREENSREYPKLGISLILFGIAVIGAKIFIF
ncbi:MAG: hypothetical protein AAF608_14495 [Pseudomonadota bacterium]